MQSTQSDTIILTYNGLDGACAAAALLLAKPDASVVAASAKRVAERIAALAENPPKEVHVCGVGVHCSWEDLAQAAQRLSAKGAAIHWYCGRGYLDQYGHRFTAFCTPQFSLSGTNTAAVIESLGLAGQPGTSTLSGLAWFDPHLENPRPKEDRSRQQAQWSDLVEAAIGQYFKYQDETPYARAIRKLAENDFDTECQAAVDAFRQTGQRYVLHGRSELTGTLRRRIQRCAAADRHVLITGESGVGKEHVAHLLQEASSRAEGPFVPVNCALFAGNGGLANSDLFGHLKGAFTGALAARKGRFVEADGGILFLDELGELPPEVQAKLLRVLEDGWVTPEGADRPERRVDVRILAATNRSLPDLIEQGTFRADLYHRISSLIIQVPPLRDRTKDIPTIVQHRLDALAQEGYTHTLSPDEYRALEGYAWPGNVRQLLKLVERAVLLDMPIGEVIDEERNLGEFQETGQARTPDELLPQSQEEVMPLRGIQKRYARRAWELHDHNYAATARALQINPNTLRYTYLAQENSQKG